MTRKIFRSILAAAGFALLASILIIMGCMYDYFTGVQTQQLWDELSLAACGVEHAGEVYLDALPESSNRLTWIAADGSVLFDDEADEQTMENHAQREEVRQALDTGEGQSTRYSSTLLEKTVYCARRLSDGSVLRISVSRATMTVLAMGMLQPICIVALLVLAVAFFLAKRISARIVEPLNHLDLDHPMENQTYEELRPLLVRINQQRHQLDAQLRVRREFTANVTHELKTPLTAILGSSEMIESGMVKPDDLPRFVGHIHDEAARLLSLIEDILRLSQLDEGAKLPLETVSLDAVAQDAARQLAEKAAGQGVALEVQAAPCTIQAVGRLVHEITYNLVDNAIKYNRSGGRVDVRVTPDGVLCVADTGIGIPEEHQARVFERFYRVDKSHSRQIGGTGLGLSIVKHACAYLGAGIELESKSGEGTTVRVSFRTEQRETE